MNSQTLTPLSATATNADRVPFIRLDAAYPELFAELMEVVERVGRDAAYVADRIAARSRRLQKAAASVPHAA